jgi:hypothetical protein
MQNKLTGQLSDSRREQMFNQGQLLESREQELKQMSKIIILTCTSPVKLTPTYGDLKDLIAREHYSKNHAKLRAITNSFI